MKRRQGVAIWWLPAAATPARRLRAREASDARGARVDRAEAVEGDDWIGSGERGDLEEER